MLNGPFSPWPDYTQDEIDAVGAVMASNRVNYWTGQQGREFEKEFSAYSQCQYAIAVANGTVALDLAWRALNMPAGSEVIVTSRTFLASVSSIVLAGLVPVFADVDADSQNITPATIAPLINAKTKAILCVHLAGWPCDMDGIMALAEANDLWVVEDCAQAHGARYKGRPVGAIGHIGAWSFCQDKIMTTAGEGGMVTTNDEALWHRMWSFKDHGKSWQAVYERDHPPGFRWLHESFGTNWRLTEMQSAVGRLQLAKMADWTAKRQANADKILTAARTCSALRVPEIPPDIEHAQYKCYVFVRPQQLKTDWDRDRIMQTLLDNGVPCFSGSCSEVYLEKAFDNTPFRPEQPLPVARELGETSLMFLVHPTLRSDEIDKTCAVLADTMRMASQ
ncbi:DegT/DnrJ/EryC1/StrS aminotransferase family protein [Aestuariibacter halophilus]|uniref:DegT/DnrJ/EryC1/StrS aminotransferase family protein n=1 Tax=Fluctibacter halophilus TaxID=226011 RepID=A0ABS8GCN1_9ALTE|nr:DegT/DnrJ/EryC1/StrS aminotransferase family protein [Aestuariibacter halophilus]MCC2618332.1 DegT/DnrJ/EryC1/StrS aminotransferase family protein [Aestuariibacter halophilus]